MTPTRKYKSDKSIVFYFQVHQPRRLKKFQFFDIGSHGDYFDDRLNERILTRVARECYLPANRMLLEVINQYPTSRLCFSVSGIALGQFEKYAPEVIDSFKALADTGAVEFLAETNYHSLASLISEEEFQTQILENIENIHHHFGLRTSVFGNAELMCNDSIGNTVSRLGFRGILSEGVERIGAQGEYAIYRHSNENYLSIIFYCNRLSNDIAMRSGDGKPALTVDDYIKSLYSVSREGDVILLGLDYEVFGDRQMATNGITNFLRDLIVRINDDNMIRMVTPSELFENTASFQSLSVRETRLWSDEQMDLPAWLGNDMQLEAFHTIKELESLVKETGSNELTDIWRQLQTSDHFYYMSTKTLSDGLFHPYFSHYPSPYEAFVNYMNIVSDFKILLKETPVQPDPTERARNLEYERQHTSPPVWALHHESHYKQTS